MRLQPKNWAVFQHYKDRSPPWIKLHRDLLNNRDFICLPIASKALAPLLWLLASETKDGIFDASYDELQFRLRISKKEYDDGIKPLIDKGFFFIASGVLAECLQDAIPEGEGEGERETEKEGEITHDLATARSSPAAPISEIVGMYNTILPMLPQVTVVSESRKRLVAARWREVVTTDKLDREKGLEFFEWFFKHVRGSRFLTGQAKDWKANFEFLFTASKFPRIIEGAYHEDKK